MKPYYETELGKLYHGDCLEIMPGLEPVDLVLTDPPYGTTACLWDSIIPLEKMWSCLDGIAKYNVILTASQPFTSVLVTSKIKNFKYEWIWQKNRGSNFAVLKYQPMKEHESVLVFSFGDTKYFPIKEDRKGSGLDRTKYKYTPTNSGKRESMGGFIMKHAKHSGNERQRFPSSIQKFNCEVGFHPTQKPITLMEYMLKTYSDKHETILDFCLGSGTTAIACERLKRRWIGIEIEEKYCEIAAKRIEAERKQLKLF